jgi:hypothetical protein
MLAKALALDPRFSAARALYGFTHLLRGANRPGHLTP